MGQLLHQLLPVAAGAEVDLVESSDVLDDLFPLHALLQRHVLGDISRDLRYVFGLSIQPQNKTARKKEVINMIE